MTLEYLEIMEDVKKRKLQKSFKSNTRIYSDGSIEVEPQAQGEPSQKDVKKVGKSKRYITNGKNPLTCVELKCPEDVPDKAAFFHRELAKLTKDMEGHGDRGAEDARGRVFAERTLCEGEVCGR